MLLLEPWQKLPLEWLLELLLLLLLLLMLQPQHQK